MASVSQRRPQRKGTIQSRERASAYQTKPRRWMKRLVIGLTLLVIIVLVLPMIVANTPLRNAPLRMAMAKMHGTIESGGASLSWFGPVCYTDLEIRDAHGQLLLAVPKFESSRSLAGLIAHLDDLGTFRVEHPKVSLAIRPDGSNLEDCLAKDPSTALAEPAHNGSSSAAKIPSLTIEIVDGQVELLDVAANRRWNLDKFNFKLRTSQESSLPVELALSAEVIPQSGKPAQLSIASLPTQSGGVDAVQAKIDALPLAMFRPLADRFAPGLQLTGNLSTNLRCAGLGNPSAGKLQLDGTITVDDALASGGPLGADRFALRRIELPCKLAYQNRRVDIEQLGMNCDVGQLAVAGSINIPDKFDSNSFAQLARSAVNVDGQLDLAKLAVLLPGTLRVRSDTQITAGQVRLTAASTPQAGGHLWTAQLTTSDLAAVHDGQKLSWDQPIDLQIAARDQAGAYSLDQVNCRSSFLAFTGSGSLDTFHAEAQCDLDRLMQQLSQFVDLGETKLAGRGDAKVDWRHDAAGAFQTSGQAKLQGLQVAMPGKPVWQEDSIAVNASGAGSVDNLTLATLGSINFRRIDAAQLSATIDNAAASAHDQIELHLLQPEITQGGARWPVTAHVQGQVGRWWPRIAAWMKLDGMDLAGACDVAVQAAYSTAGVEIQQVKATINGLHAWGWDSLFIDEPVVQLEASGGYEFATNRMILNRSSLLTSTLSVQTDSATVAAPPGKPLALQGNIVYQADLTRLMRWISDPRTPPDYALSGRLVGNLEAARNGSSTDGRINATVDNLAVYVFDDNDTPRTNSRGAPARNPQPVWQEQRLTVSAAGGIDSSTDTAQLASLDIGSQALALHTSGKIAKLSTQRDLDLAGKIDYDWQSLGPLLKPILGNSVAIAGRQSRDFSVRGPIGVADSNPSQAGDKFAWLHALVANAAFGWSQADMFGLRMGKLDVDAHLENGQVQLKPIDMRLGNGATDGRLTVAPLVRLTPGQAELELGKGPLLSNVQFTQTGNNPWLRFIAPVLSQPSRAEGIVTVDLDGAKIPLDDPNKSDIGGRLIIRNMEITPGPLARPLVLAGKQIEAIVKRRPPPLDLSGSESSIKIDDQNVDFRMVDGRIYHQGFTMHVGEVTIKTRGWVATDETVNIVAELQVKQEWTNDRNSPFASLGEPVIRVPITGNLKDPKFDTRVMLKLLEAIPRAAIEGEIGKQLDKLFSTPQR